MKTYTAANGVSFTYKLIKVGDKYGATNSLINDKEDMIEFYDYRHKHTNHGQFITRYYISTMGEHLDDSDHAGLDLYGSVEAWTIDFDTLCNIMADAYSEF